MAEFVWDKKKKKYVKQLTPFEQEFAKARKDDRGGQFQFDPYPSEPYTGDKFSTRRADEPAPEKSAFDLAFQTARQEGKETFVFNGKLYTTRRENVADWKWKENLQTIKKQRQEDRDIREGGWAKDFEKSYGWAWDSEKNIRQWQSPANKRRYVEGETKEQTLARMKEYYGKEIEKKVLSERERSGRYHIR